MTKRKLKIKPRPSFTIPEIRAYLDGCTLVWEEATRDRYIPENRALIYALDDLEDPEDGIAAVTKRIARRAK